MKAALAFENDFCDGLFCGVRYRKCSISHAQLRRKLAGFSVKRDRRSTARHADNFTILPAHAVIPSRPQGFHGRFLSSETRGIALHAVGFGIAIAPFTRSINALQKALAKAFDRLPNARNLCDVNASAND